VIGLGGWHLVAVTYDSSNGNAEPMFYVDGVRVGSSHYLLTSDPTNNPEDDGPQTLLFGNASGGTTRTFDGLIDEVRVSTTIRSPQWLATTHASQSDPAGFIGVGPEEDTR